MADALSISLTLALGGFGGFVRYLQVFAGKKDERPEWEWSVAAIRFVIGAFVGILTLWIIGKKFEADYVHFAVAVAGYGGPLTIDAFWEALRNTFNRAASGSKDDAPKG